MSGNEHSNELGAFLKARRGELIPHAAGLPDTGAKRRVKGLRREEFGLLASISIDYYTRIEQGRRLASELVLATLAQVLRLSDEERAHLLEVAGKDAARPRRQAMQKVQPQLRRILDELTTSPAMVLGRRMDILAWNPIAATLFTDFANFPEGKRNYAWLIFTDADIRALHTNWEREARGCVAML